MISRILAIIGTVMVFISIVALLATGNKVWSIAFMIGFTTIIIAVGMRCYQDWREIVKDFRRTKNQVKSKTDAADKTEGSGSILDTYYLFKGDKITVINDMMLLLHKLSEIKTNNAVALEVATKANVVYRSLNTAVMIAYIEGEPTILIRKTVLGEAYHEITKLRINSPYGDAGTMLIPCWKLIDQLM